MHLFQCPATEEFGPLHLRRALDFPGGASGNEPDSQSMQDTQETLGLIPRWERSPEEGMATRSSILAWRIPWTEAPGGLLSVRVTKSRTRLKQLSTYVTENCICTKKKPLLAQL